MQLPCRFSRLPCRFSRPAVRLVRHLSPAPSASWDPSRIRHSLDEGAAAIRLTVRLPEDAVLETTGQVGESLMGALEAADLSDVWPGGACGGMCACSTCRVVVLHAPQPPPPREEEEEDMLDVAATAAAKLADADEDANAALLDQYLDGASRLACQWELRPSDDGLVIELPEDVCNVLEVPLWLRGSR
jgi:ferredoxin